MNFKFATTSEKHNPEARCVIMPGAGLSCAIPQIEDENILARVYPDGDVIFTNMVRNVRWTAELLTEFSNLVNQKGN